MKLLVIEDEIELSRSICTYLGRSNFICEASYDLDDAVKKIAETEYECILLDITLPKGNGLSLLNRWKTQAHRGGVIIISAKNSLEDKVSSLQLGADDYLTKPFHLAELSARVESIVRRKYFGGQIRVVTDELSVDTEERRLYVNGSQVDLTRKEYQLLLYLVANRNKVVTVESMVEHLWGEHFEPGDQCSFVYTHIKNLRKKMARHSSQNYIRAVYGMGYKFSADQ